MRATALAAHDPQRSENLQDAITVNYMGNERIEVDWEEQT
jgi:hypothetical protein